MAAELVAKRRLAAGFPQTVVPTQEAMPTPSGPAIPVTPGQGSSASSSGGPTVQQLTGQAAGDDVRARLPREFGGHGGAAEGQPAATSPFSRGWRASGRMDRMEVDSLGDSRRLDPRLLDKPQPFVGDPAAWRIWKRKFRSWLIGAAPHLEDALDQAEKHLGPIRWEDVPVQLADSGRFLYALLMVLSAVAFLTCWQALCVKTDGKLGEYCVTRWSRGLQERS